MDMNEKIIAIVGITEAIKQYGVPGEYCPSVAIIVGALFGYAEKPDSQGILEGAILGATCTGGYAVTKRVGKGAISPFTQDKKFDYSKLEADDDRGL